MSHCWVTANDEQVITARLQWIKDKGGLLPGDTDVPTAWAGIQRYALEFRAIIISDMLILWDIGQPWYSDQKYLYEQFVLRLTPRADPTRVPGVLERIAAHEGCAAVIAGDSLAGKMTPFYEQAGWHHLGTTLMKEITNVRRQGG